MNKDNIVTYIYRYFNKLKGDKKSINTINNYKSTFNSFNKYIEENSQEGEYDTYSFRKLVFDFIYSLDSSYLATTINAKRTAIRKFVSYVAAEEKDIGDFSRDIELLKVDKGKEKQVLTSTEIQKIIQVLSDEFSNAIGYDIYYKARNLLLFSVLLWTGVRRSELVIIKWTDIDMLNNRIKVLGKGNKTRYIPLKKELKYQIIEFKDLLERLDEAGYDVKSDYIFRSDHRSKDTKKKDKPMTPKNVEHILKSTIKKSGITKNITPHNLRHNFASYWIKDRRSIPNLADILGHSTPDITMKIYAQVISEDEKKREMEEFGFGLE
ncbi:tyrosine-type recombinase/integrase [Wukongibacter baidiensis]